MKVSYKVRSSQSPWSRVMRSVGQLAGRSVHRGKTAQCIELRNQFFAIAALVVSWGRNSDVERQRRVRHHPHGAQDHTYGNNPRGSWEIPETSLSSGLDRSEKFF